MDTTGDDTITSSSAKGKAPAPPPQDREETMQGVEKDAFQDSFEEGAEEFYPTSWKASAEVDAAKATTSLHNTTELLNLWTDKGYRIPEHLTDSFATELLQVVYSASEIGLIRQVANGASQVAALEQVIESLRSQLPPGPPPPPVYGPSGSGLQPPHSSNATSDPAGLHRPRKKLIPAQSSCQPPPPPPRPTPASFASTAAATASLSQPPPAKRRKGSAAMAEGLVQMAKSFPSAPNASIIQVQQIVAGGAGPS